MLMFIRWKIAMKHIFVFISIAILSGCATPVDRYVPVAKSFIGHPTSAMVQAYGTPTQIKDLRDQADILGGEIVHLRWQFENMTAEEQGRQIAEAEAIDVMEKSTECTGDINGASTNSGFGTTLHSGTLRSNCREVERMNYGLNANKQLALGSARNARKACDIQATSKDGVITQVQVYHTGDIYFNHGCQLAPQTRGFLPEPQTQSK